jgi:hypothetical protein
VAGSFFFLFIEETKMATGMAGSLSLWLLGWIAVTSSGRIYLSISLSLSLSLCFTKKVTGNGGGWWRLFVGGGLWVTVDGGVWAIRWLFD